MSVDGAAILGHDPPGLLAALRRSLDRPAPMTAPLGLVAEAGELADRLLSLAGHGLAKVHFGSTGAEAVDAAMKLAAARTGRRRFLGVAGGFHGLSIGATALAGDELWRTPFPSLWPDAAQVAPGDPGAVDRALAARDVAALVLEVVPGSGAGDGWAAEALLAVAASCRRHGTMLVVDEVQTGLGRVGRDFAFHAAGDAFRPDMVIVSKALTGGIVPVSAVLMTDAVFDATFGGAGRAKIHGSTLAGNRLAMECGLAVLDLVRAHGLVARAAMSGVALRRALAPSLAREGLRILGQGLLLAVELGRSPAQAQARCLSLLRRGVLVAPAAHAPTFIRLTPPLVIDEEEIGMFAAAVAETMAERTAD